MAPSRSEIYGHPENRASVNHEVSAGLPLSPYPVDSFTPFLTQILRHFVIISRSHVSCRRRLFSTILTEIW